MHFCLSVTYKISIETNRIQKKLVPQIYNINGYFKPMTYMSYIYAYEIELRLYSSLTLCCFVVYSTRQFILPCVILFLCFSFLLALRLPCLGKRELTIVLFIRCSICACLVLSVSSSSWCLGRAAAYDCGIPWTFLLPFLYIH